MMIKWWCLMSNRCKKHIKMSTDQKKRSVAFVLCYIGTKVLEKGRTWSCHSWCARKTLPGTQVCWEMHPARCVRAAHCAQVRRTLISALCAERVCEWTWSPWPRCMKGHLLGQPIMSSHMPRNTCCSAWQTSEPCETIKHVYTKRLLMSFCTCVSGVWVRGEIPLLWAKWEIWKENLKIII